MAFNSTYMIFLGLYVFRCNYVSILHRFRDIIAYFRKLKTSRDRDHAHSMDSL